MDQSTARPDACHIGRADIHLYNIRLPRELIVDELHLAGGEIRIFDDGGGRSVSTGEIAASAVISEVNLNRVIASNVPDDAPIKNLQIAIFSSRVRITGAALRPLAVPFTIEATLRIENGVRIMLDWQNASVGLGLPKMLVDMLEQRINDKMSLDMSALPVPVWIDSIQCEPGRLTAIGRARITAPPTAPTENISAIVAIPAAPVTMSRGGFVVSDRPLFETETVEADDSHRLRSPGAASPVDAASVLR